MRTETESRRVRFSNQEATNSSSVRPVSLTSPASTPNAPLHLSISAIVDSSSPAFLASPRWMSHSGRQSVKAAVMRIISSASLWQKTVP